jgi:hypothetical protein
MNWDSWDVKSGDPKGMIAQIVACIGPEVAKEMVISFSG